jgi:Uma2 family endonuclease
MSQVKTRPRKSTDDFMQLPEGTLAELIGGELLMTPSPKSLHQIVTGNIYMGLRVFVDPRGLGRVLAAPMDVHLPTGDIVEPDVIFVSSGRSSILQDWVRGAPDLLIEVISPEGVERDRLVKRDLYARNGVQEYWLVDPSSRSVEVLKLGPSGSYDPAGYFEERDTLSSPVLAGLALPVAPLFK